MRTEFFKTRYLAKKYATWACVIMKVEGGYRAFESIDDYFQSKRNK